MNQYELRNEVTWILQQAKNELAKFGTSGERIIHTGGAFGDVVDDTELEADEKLGDFLKDRLFTIAEFGRITIESPKKEGLKKDYRLDSGGDWWCTIDPLDGSLNFKQRCGTLGLPYTGVVTVLDRTDEATFANVILAAVIDYRSGDLWFAHKDAGGIYRTFCNDVPVRGIQETTLDLGRMIAFGEMYYPENREKIMRGFAGEKGWLRNPGSAAYEMAGVASGIAAAFICDRQKQHELGAAYGLVKGAGGVAIDFSGQDLGQHTFDFFSQTPVILAGNAQLGQDILRRIQRT